MKRERSKYHFAARCFIGSVSSAIVFLSIGCSRQDRDVTPPAHEPRTVRVLASLPEFSLTDQKGNQYGSQDLVGTVWITTFIFTRCRSTCPAQTEAFSQLQAEFKERTSWGDVHLVSTTVDPEYDTPQVLAAYGTAVGADFERWHFLSGARSAIWDLCKKGFKLDVQTARESTSGLITHSPMLILVDSQARIRGYYELNDRETLLKDMQVVLAEPRAEKSTAPVNADEVRRGLYPPGVRNPTWLVERAAAQLKTVDKLRVFHDFKFTNQIEQSEITFRQTVVEDVGRLYKAAHYDHGTGIAVADVDGDGRLDIYFVDQLGSNELWKNLGGGRFENITERAGVAIHDGVSVAASFADIDNDGDADLFVTTVRKGNRLFENDGAGRFKDATAGSGLEYVGHSSGSVFFDFDRDGLLDLLLSNVGEYTTDALGLGGYYIAHRDAFAGQLKPERNEASILYRNLGDGRFTNVNARMGFNDVSWSGDASPLDSNEDGWPDIYLLDMQGHDEYYENDGGKRFIKKSRELFPRTPWGSMGIKVFDYDRDGQLDIYITDMHTDMVDSIEPTDEKLKVPRNHPLSLLATDGNHVLGNAFFRKEGPDRFVEISDRIGAENYWPWGITVADFNADGFEDVFIAASMNYPFRYGINSLLLNNQGKGFVDSEFILGIEPRQGEMVQHWFDLDCSGADKSHEICTGQSGKMEVWGARGTRSSVVFDIDDDGDLDIVSNDFGGPPMILVSSLTDRKEIHYLSVELQGTKSNRDGLGAVIRIQVGDRTLVAVHDGKSGYLSQSRAPLYFGLDDAKRVDRIDVSWPSGLKQVVDGPIEVNQKLTIVEGV